MYQIVDGKLVSNFSLRRVKMHKALIAGIAVLSMFSASAVHADDDMRLPKEFWGKWCVKGSATGGEVRFWYYSRSQAECDAQDIMPESWRTMDMTIGPYSKR